MATQQSLLKPNNKNDEDNYRVTDLDVIAHYLNFTPAPGEILLQCPYEVSHIVLEHRMGRHLEKCRKRYEKELGEKGLIIRRAVCQWNKVHYLCEEESDFHSYYCSSKSKAPFNIGEEAKFAKPVVHHTEIDVAFSEENWENDCRGTYDPAEWMELRGIIKQPTGLTKGEKKKFRRASHKLFSSPTSETHLKGNRTITSGPIYGSSATTTTKDTADTVQREVLAKPKLNLPYTLSDPSKEQVEQTLQSIEEFCNLFTNMQIH